MPGSAALGNVVTGLSAKQDFQVQNTSSVPVTVSHIVMALDDQSVSGEYAEVDTCHSTLAPQATCVVTATLTPQILGPRNGLLSLLINEGITSQSASITATGITALGATPASVDFGATTLGVATSPVQIMLTNQSGASQPFALSIGGAFTLSSNTCVSPLAAGAKCTVAVTFLPAVAGPQQSMLTASIAEQPNTPRRTPCGKRSCRQYDNDAEELCNDRQLR